MTFLYILDLVGTGVFAISGALSALNKKIYHDLFGMFFVGFLTAIGGGTMRDIAIGAHPLVWIRDSSYIIVILLGVALAILLRKLWMNTLRRPLLFFDTLGVGLFTILGAQKAIAFGVNAWAAVLLGMISAIFGGVLRDTLVNDLPIIFSKEIYATACLAGAVFYVFGRQIGMDPALNLILSVGIITAIRLLSIRYGWSLPRIEV
ncbi:trimeric intracellular cation channel family protein [Larkinella soli]|uniref:trimeric intracellular cation channel family protein n=1 Tax=Larkinella soli TaxID=1770527 RepID=UPI000FFB9389|nr:trimeric intracellular cation channel family protein [Larkinella soli]